MAIRSIDDSLRAMRTSFVPAAAGDRSMVLQYDFTGREEGVCHAVIAAGTITVAHGAHPAPTAVVVAWAQPDELLTNRSGTCVSIAVQGTGRC